MNRNPLPRMVLIGVILTMPCWVWPQTAMPASQGTPPPAHVEAPPRDLPDARVGEPYEYVIHAQGLTEPIVFAWDGDTLPWMRLNGAHLSGTPDLPCVEPRRITVTITDALQNSVHTELRLKIRPPILPLTVTTQALPDFTLDAAVSFPCAATGGEPPYRWTCTPVEMPAGLNVDLADQATRCVVTGTPHATGPVKLVATVQDSLGRQAEATVEGRVILPPAPPLTLTGESANSVTYRSPFTLPFLAAGGYPPYEWTVAWAQDAPPWASFDTSRGVLSGTGDVLGECLFSIAVTDQMGQRAQFENVSLSVNRPVETEEIRLIGADLPAGTVGLGYNALLAVSGRIGYVRWKTNLPEDLSWLSVETDGDYLKLNGTPSVAGSWAFAVTVYDLMMPDADEQNAKTVFSRCGPVNVMLRVIMPAPAPGESRPAVVTSVLPVAIVGRPYMAQLAATGGQGEIAFYGNRQQNDWWSVSRAGLLTGTPAAPGTSTISVNTEDASGNRSESARIVMESIEVDTPELRLFDIADVYACVGKPLRLVVPAVGGIPPLRYSLAGSEQKDFAIDQNTGILSGKTSSPGMTTLRVHVEDSSEPPHMAECVFSIEAIPAETVKEVVKEMAVPAAMSEDAVGAEQRERLLATFAGFAVVLFMIAVFSNIRLRWRYRKVRLPQGSRGK